ncbi:MAG TPA: ATP-binding protein [Salinisphaeraceae bacterium]|nr:ATP-binding protein [Salinisphaeraceae bacterium]
MNSLRARLLAATGVLLLAFIILVGFALETAVSKRMYQAQRDRLQGLTYALLGNAEITASGMFNIPTGVLPEADLARPGSGLYALTLDGEGNTIWRSPSMYGTIQLEQPPAVGAWQFTRATGPSNNTLLVLAFGFRWVVQSGQNYRYTLIVAEDASALIGQMNRFRSTLWPVLFVAALALLIVELLILRWGLAPLRRLAQALHTLQRDEQRQIGGRYPSEIQPLVTSLNTMLANDEARLQRYRNALGDLAHSLKTPMAILHGLADEGGSNTLARQQAKHQLERMNDILDYQLQKAAAAGKRSLARPIAIAPVVARLARALSKVYAEQQVRFTTAVAASLKARIDEGDLTELLGTVMDNAAKYGGDRIHVAAEINANELRLIIDDNGAGFPPDYDRELLERGVRADTTREGQGLGLAVAAELVRSYTGTIELDHSPQGGARVIIHLPVV